MDKIENKYHISELLDIYGNLLTDRQRDFMDLYYNEDFSFGEIAENEKISRQAVHDAIQNGKKSLEHFEEQLRLVQKKKNNDLMNNESHASSEQVNRVALKEGLEEIYLILKNDDIIYDTQPIRKKVKSLLEIIGD